MNHAELKEMIWMSHDKELSAPETSLVNQHLDQCSECRELYADWEKTSAILFPASAHRPSENFTQKVMARIHLEASKKSLWDKVFPLFTFPRLAFATAALLVLSLIIVGRPSKPPISSGESGIEAEYLSELAQAPFSNTEESRADIGTPIETYFL
jgi:anti-sigma factor RsiW